MNADEQMERDWHKDLKLQPRMRDVRLDLVELSKDFEGWRVAETLSEAAKALWEEDLRIQKRWD